MITERLAEPEDQGCQDDSGSVAVGEFIEPGRDRAELLEAGEASFDYVAVAVDGLVECGWPTAEGPASSAVGRLVAALGDRGDDASAPQQVADRPAGVRLVAQHAFGRCARAAPCGARDADPGENLAEDGGVVDVAGREHDRQGKAPAVDGEVDFGGQSTSGSAEGLARLRAARIFQFVPVCIPFLRAPAACW